ncbi:unnamed protein product [Heterosigma akashiwo]
MSRLASSRTTTSRSSSFVKRGSSAAITPPAWGSVSEHGLGLGSTVEHDWYTCCLSSPAPRASSEAGPPGPRRGPRRGIP